MSKTSPNRDPGRITRKRLIVAALCVVAAVVLAWGIREAYLSSPPRLPETPDEALATIGTEEFDRMPEYRRTEYLRQTGHLLHQLPEAQRARLLERHRADEHTRRALRLLRRAEMEERIKRFAEASPEERNAILDETLIERAARRDAPAPGSRARPDPRRIKQDVTRRIQHGDPQRQALTVEFNQALGERQKQPGSPGK